jgi:hypothetical protein
MSDNYSWLSENRRPTDTDHLRHYLSIVLAVSLSNAQFSYSELVCRRVADSRVNSNQNGTINMTQHLLRLAKNPEIQRVKITTHQCIY